MWPNRFGIMRTWLGTSSGHRTNSLLSIANNQQRSHGHPCWLPHIHEETSSEPLCLVMYHSLLLRDMWQSQRREIWHPCVTTSWTQATCYPHCSFVSISRYCIPVSPWLNHNVSGQTRMDTVIPSGPKVNISSSWRSKSHSWTIAVTRHTIQHTQNLFYYFPVTGRFI